MLGAYWSSSGWPCCGTRLVARFFADDADKIAAWFSTINPGLGASPADLIALGQAHKVLRFVEQAMEDGR